MLSVAKPKPVIDSPGTYKVLDFSSTLAFADNPHPLADVFMIYRNTSNIMNPYNAFEFVLEWCVQEFNTSVVNVTASTARQYWTNNFAGGAFLTRPVFNSTSSFGFASGGPNFGVQNDTHFILSNHHSKTLNGSVYIVGGGKYKPSDAAEAFFWRFNRETGNETVRPKNITDRASGRSKSSLAEYCNSMTNM